MTSDNTLKPIVHVATDEKFIDAAYEIYEKAFPGKNLFIILLENRNVLVRYLAAEKQYKFLYLNDNYLQQIQNISTYSKAVVFHGLDAQQAQVSLALSNNNRKIRQIWSVYGGEVYHNPQITQKNIYGSKTFKKYLGKKYYVKNFLRPYYYRLLKAKKSPYNIQKMAMKNMDFIAILYKEEHSYYKRLQILKDGAEHLKFTYYPLNIVIRRNRQKVFSNNILLGNSASYTNNHLEAFELLKKFNIKDRKIITPLSYGKEEYANDIVNKGKALFGSNFEPLTKFLQLKDYQKVLRSCGIVIMNHYRQQAVGNVLNALFLGSKVYLSKKNTLYHFLRRIRCHIYAIEDDLIPGKDPFSLLNNDQIKHNRTILRNELSLERVVLELQEKITPLLN